jgi:hypothetical protein
MPDIKTLKPDTFLIFCLILAFSLFRCSKVDELLTFSISDQTSFRVESSSPLNLPLEIATPDVTTNSSQKFQNNNTNASKVKDIKLDEIRLTVTNPSGKTFNFLKSCKVYISTTQSNEILLASSENIPMDITTVTLTPTQEKLDTYVKASSYKLRTSIVTRETLSQAVDVQVDLKFKVTADPL